MLKDKYNPMFLYVNDDFSHEYRDLSLEIERETLVESLICNETSTLGLGNIKDTSFKICYVRNDNICYC